MVRIFAQLPDQVKAKNSAKMVFKYIDKKSKIDSLDESGIKPNETTGEIRFENVYFSLPHRGDMKLLRGFNLEIKPGQISAITGPSGMYLDIILCKKLIWLKYI